MRFASPFPDPKLTTPKVMDINVNGVLFTAQAAGRQMVRFGRGGSIVLVASIAGSIALQVCPRSLSKMTQKNTDAALRERRTWAWSRTTPRKAPSSR